MLKNIRAARSLREIIPIFGITAVVLLFHENAAPRSSREHYHYVSNRTLTAHTHSAHIALSTHHSSARTPHIIKYYNRIYPIAWRVRGRADPPRDYAKI